MYLLHWVRYHQCVTWSKAGMMCLMFLHSTKKEKEYDCGLQLWACFSKTVYSGVYTVLSLSFPHTYSKHPACVCVYVHVNTRRRSRNKVIKTVRLAAPLQFLFEATYREWEEVSQCASRLPPSSSSPPPAAAAVMFVCHLARCQGGGASTHCWAQGHRNPTACKTPQLCFVHACVTVCKCLGVRRRQQFWEQKVKVMCIYACTLTITCCILTVFKYLQIHIFPYQMNCLLPFFFSTNVIWTLSKIKRKQFGESKIKSVSTNAVVIIIIVNVESVSNVIILMEKKKI